MRATRGRIRAGSTALAISLTVAVLVGGCGENSAKVAAQRRRERHAAIERATHPKFPIAPCSLVSLEQVSKLLGIHARKQSARAGCIYTGTVTGSHDTRTLTVTPASVPSGGHLITTAIQHPEALSGAGFHAQVGNVPAPGSIQAPATAVAGVLAGKLYVALTVQDANANAPSQINRAAAIARLLGERLHTSARS
jgi:hypothetical protein